MAHQSRATYRQFLAFALVGTLGFLVDAGIVYGITSQDGNALIAQLAAFTVAVHVTWWGNRSWAFGGQSRWASLRHEWAIYISSNSLGWLVNNGVYAALVLTVPLVAHEPVWAVAVGSLAGLLFNYSAARRVVFR